MAKLGNRQNLVFNSVTSTPSNSVSVLMCKMGVQLPICRVVMKLRLDTMHVKHCHDVDMQYVVHDAVVLVAPSSMLSHFLLCLLETGCHKAGLNRSCGRKEAMKGLGKPRSCGKQIFISLSPRYN